MAISRDEFKDFVNGVNDDDNLLRELNAFMHPMQGHMRDNEHAAWQLEQLIEDRLGVEKPRTEVGRKEAVLLYRGFPKVTVCQKRYALVGCESNEWYFQAG